MMNYAIVGGGRLARHFSQYFQLLGIPHTRWARDSRSPFNTYELADAGQRLIKTVKHADQVLLLVSDKAIAALLKQYPFLHDKKLIHCSGALSIPGVAGAHPLMTFADRLYELDVYQSMPFVLETGHRFDDLFPDLSNPHFVVGVEDKARYHAMCVMAGNFTQLMWKEISGRFEDQFEWPAEAVHPYLKQVMSNFIHAPHSALTGPLVRNDMQTIDRNIGALENDPLKDLYLAFMRFYQSNETQNPVLQQNELEQAL